MNLDRLSESFLAAVSAELADGDRDLELERRGRLAQAQAEADRMLVAARERGLADASEETVRALATARREARSRVLAARRDLYDLVCASALARCLSLRGSSRYPQLLERLTEELRSAMGDAAVIDVDPDPVGGVVAREGARLIDCSLPSLARRCLAALEPQIAELWR